MAKCVILGSQDFSDDEVRSLEAVMKGLLESRDDIYEIHASGNELNATYRLLKRLHKHYRADCTFHAEKGELIWQEKDGDIMNWIISYPTEIEELGEARGLCRLLESMIWDADIVIVLEGSQFDDIENIIRYAENYMVEIIRI